MFNGWECSVGKSVFHSLAFVGQVHLEMGQTTETLLLCVCCPNNTDQLSSWAFIAAVKSLSLSLSVYLSQAARGPKSDCVTV